MLTEQKLVGFLGTSNAEKARAFYEGVLGLPFKLEIEHLVVFDWGAGRLMLQKTDKVTPPFGAAMGWQVGDIRAQMRELMSRGVVFERFAGMTQDEMGVWSPEPGSGVAWFKDPDGNLLSLSQG